MTPQEILARRVRVRRVRATPGCSAARCQIFSNRGKSTPFAQQRHKTSSASTATPTNGDAPTSFNRGAAMLKTVGQDLSNGQLLRWMFRFVRPVIGLVCIACFWLVLWVATEMLTVRQAGVAINHINALRSVTNAAGSASGFRAWLRSGEPQAVDLVHLVRVLLALVCAYALLRYLKEVSNSKMSMNLVFYIREAIYDKLQRVGFGFHDAISTGQLINRALSDLQNVRQFVQTAILSTLEIVLVVVWYIALISRAARWLAGIVADAAADLDALHAALQQEGPTGRQGRDGGGGQERLDHHREHRRRSRGEGVRDRSAGN